MRWRTIQEAFLKKTLISKLLTKNKISKTILPVGNPTQLDIEVTNLCNLNCAFCPTGTGENTRPVGKMSMDIFKKIINGLTNKTNLQLAGYGEPLLNKNVANFIKYANEKGIDNIFIFTNLLAATKDILNQIMLSKFRRLYVSIDTLSEDYYYEYKGRKLLPNALEKLELLSEMLRGNKYLCDKIYVQMVVTNKNIHEQKQFGEFVRRKGFVACYKTLNVELVSGGDNVLTEMVPNSFSRYGNRAYSRQCYWLWGGAIVYWNGDISICCNDPLGKYIEANICDVNKISEILWRNKSRNNFRKIYYDNPAAIDICKMCRFA
jgi:sulfatase maturation enzyme AslB (radical SAM superfamily)